MRRISWPRRAEMLRGGKRRDMRQDAISDAEIIQQAKNFVVDRDRARLVIHVAVPIDRKRADAVLAEQAGRYGARRAKSHNHDLEIVRFRGGRDHSSALTKIRPQRRAPPPVPP